VLGALDRRHGGHLFRVPTLFEVVQAKGLATATVGKSGPAFLQDHHRGGLIIDEHHVWPRAAAAKFAAAGAPLPLHTPVAYDDAFALDEDNGDPTARTPMQRLRDDSASDPVAGTLSGNTDANRYLVRSFLAEAMTPAALPALSVLWLRDPDTTEHQYGPGAKAVRDALAANDRLLGELLDRLRATGLAASTDVIVMSDHGHSSVAGSPLWFPPRALSGGAPGGIDETAGWSVSGEVRMAELLRRADPTLEVYDDHQCLLAPSLSGIRRDGTVVAPVQTDDSGALCRRAGTRYTSAVPALAGAFLLGRRSIVIASNGGSEYLYLPEHDRDTLERAVRALQQREQVGAIFVSAKRYPELPAGTLPMTLARVDAGSEETPDLIVSYHAEADTPLHGAAGIEYAAMEGNRGNHGSFSRRDVHNTLIAAGPHFRKGFVDELPTGNVDIAPTVAHLLGIPFEADGRVLGEALAGGRDTDYRKEAVLVRADRAAEGLHLCYATDLDCAERAAADSRYRAVLRTQRLRQGDHEWRYIDGAEVER
jgi:arylsulfatase A-like enzyme